MSDLYHQAKTAMESGDKALAKQLLSQVIIQDPRNEAAWMLMSDVVEDIKQKRNCLERVLALNPENNAASSALSRLNTSPLEPVTRGERDKPIIPPPPEKIPPFTPPFTWDSEPTQYLALGDLTFPDLTSDQAEGSGGSPGDLSWLKEPEKPEEIPTSFDWGLKPEQPLETPSAFDWSKKPETSFEPPADIDWTGESEKRTETPSTFDWGRESGKPAETPSSFDWGGEAGKPDETLPTFDWGKESGKPDETLPTFDWGKESGKPDEILPTFDWGKESGLPDETLPTFDWGSESEKPAEATPTFDWARESGKPAETPPTFDWATDSDEPDKTIQQIFNAVSSPELASQSSSDLDLGEEHVNQYDIDQSEEQEIEDRWLNELVGEAPEAPPAQPEVNMEDFSVDADMTLGLEAFTSPDIPHEPVAPKHLLWDNPEAKADRLVILTSSALIYANPEPGNIPLIISLFDENKPLPELLGENTVTIKLGSIQRLTANPKATELTIRYPNERKSMDHKLKFANTHVRDEALTAMMLRLGPNFKQTTRHISMRDKIASPLFIIFLMVVLAWALVFGLPLLNNLQAFQAGLLHAIVAGLQSIIIAFGEGYVIAIAVLFSLLALAWLIYNLLKPADLVIYDRLYRG